MNLPHKNVADCFAIPSKKLIFVPEFSTIQIQNYILYLNKRINTIKYKY